MRASGFQLSCPAVQPVPNAPPSTAALLLPLSCISCPPAAPTQLTRLCTFCCSAFSAALHLLLLSCCHCAATDRCSAATCSGSSHIHCRPSQGVARGGCGVRTQPRCWQPRGRGRRSGGRRCPSSRHVGDSYARGSGWVAARMARDTQRLCPRRGFDGCSSCARVQGEAPFGTRLLSWAGKRLSLTARHGADTEGGDA